MEKGDFRPPSKTVCQEARIIRDARERGRRKMQKEEKKEEKAKGKQRKPYQKPELTAEELFEATVLSCTKAHQGCSPGKAS